MKNSRVILAILLLAGTSAAFGDEPSSQPKPLVLRFYSVAEFVRPPVSNAAAMESHQLMPQASGGVGGGLGGGGQGGGLGGGGGYFSVPTTAIGASVTSASTTQFGGVGRSGDFSHEDVSLNLMSKVQNSDVAFSGLINLIAMHVAPDSWELNGGQATITAVNETLLIQQDEETHKQVTDFLKQLHQHTMGDQPVTIELWWLPLNLEQRQALTDQIAQAEASATLNTLCDLVGGYHGELKTRNGLTGTLSSGYSTPVIAGQVPVVGNGASGLQPIMSELPIGLSANVTPRITAAGDEHSVQLAVQTEKTVLRDFESTETTGGSVDRYQLGRHSLTADCTCQFEVPTIIGSLSTVGLAKKSGDHSTELVLVVKVSQ